MNFTGNTKELVLIHNQMERLSTKKRVNIMLTPQFYTLKREALPVKYTYQAKRIGPSLFDGLLEEGRGYDYFVLKEAEEWVFIAYDKERIKAFLQTKGIHPDKVGKVFFAQQSVEMLSSPILLGEHEALTRLHGTAVIVPQSVFPEKFTTLTFNNKFTPKKGVSLKESEILFFSVGQVAVFAIMLLGLAGIFGYEGWRYAQGDTAKTEEMQGLLEEYPALESRYVRESLMSKFKKIDRKERKKREIIHSIAKAVFKGVTLNHLTISNKAFSAQFSCQTKAMATKLKSLLQKEKFQVTLKGTTAEIKGKL